MEKLRMKNAIRYAGDGMEVNKTSDETRPNHKIEMRAPTSQPNSNYLSEIPQPARRKEPKFVPYEPYKAAVNPIVPDQGNNHLKKKKSKSPLTETHIPFPLPGTRPLSTSVIRVLRDASRDGSQSPTLSAQTEAAFQAEKDRWEEEKIKMENEITRLKEGKRDMENQFKIQTQVNAELKKLLVASLGEDMQSRVQFLSEDKARLAQDIAHYYAVLSQEHEELERLAIQSDIWRSKFLACSLMVDELASWKASLSRKFEESKEALQWMLDEHKEMKQNDVQVYRFLKQLNCIYEDNATFSTSGPMNLLKLSQGNRFFAEALQFRLLASTEALSRDPLSCEGNTPAEEVSLRVLANSGNLPDNMEFKESKNWSNLTKMCRHHSVGWNNLTHHGCRHCSGEIDVI